MHRAALALLLAGCFGAGDADAPMLRIVGEPIEVREVLHRNEASLDDDSLGLYRVFDLALLGDTIVLIDGNDRVLFLSSDLRVVRTFGRKGSGPGELDFPWSIRRWGERLVVADAGNRRLTFFDRDGNAERTLAIPGIAAGRPFGIAADGTLYFPQPTEEHYLVRVSDGGEPESFARRPARREDLPRLRTPAGLPDVIVTYDHVAVTPDGRVHVLDNLTGMLLRYSPAGELETARMVLTKDHIEEHRRRTQSIRAGSRRSVGFSPLFNGMRVNETTGELIVVLPFHDASALVIDPATYEARAIAKPPQTTPYRALRGAHTVALLEDRLIAAHLDGVVVYALKQ